MPSTGEEPTDLPEAELPGEELFWDLVEPMYADPAVRRSTMMGLPCVRLDGRFFASLDRGTGALLVKLPAERVTALVAAGEGEPFAPAGRVFREWVAVPRPDRRRWGALLAEARDHAAGHPDRGVAGGTRAPTAQGAGREANPFRGFGAGGLEFLAGLERDNTKAFFDAHRDVYRRELLEPSKAFVVALGDQLRRRVSTGLRAEPRVGGSLFRIANDMRFAKHGPPYRPHLDFVFWEGADGPRGAPSLILRITPTEIHAGCGAVNLTGTALAAYRAALRDDARVALLDRLVDALLTEGAELSPATRRRPPPGLDGTGAAGRFAVRDGFHLARRDPLPPVATTPALVGWCTDHLVPFAPVHRWWTDVASAP
jgi:uncharacterized protein (DUF2461 family)